MQYLHFVLGEFFKKGLFFSFILTLQSCDIIGQL